MSRCTAPVRGHSSAEAAANCPACRYKSRGYSSYYSSYSSPYSSHSSLSSSGSYSSKSKPRWSKSSSSVSYTSAQIVNLTPIREAVESRVAIQPDLRDVFYVMHGLIVKSQRKSYMICSKLRVLKFGLVKKILVWACL